MLPPSNDKMNGQAKWAIHAKANVGWFNSTSLQSIDT